MSKRAWLIDAVLLFAFSAWLIGPKFKAEYLDNWASIDSTFIADGKYLKDHWPNPAWQPNWYCGTRFDYIYPPMLRYGTAGISLLLNVSTGRAYHLYTAIFYCLGIVGVYVLTRIGAGSRVWAWIVALAATLVSPVYLFLPHIRQDYAGSLYMPARLGVLTRYGEGPHMSAFAILPFALAAAWYGLRKGRPGMLAASAILSAIIVSNNFYGATALALLFPILAWTVFLADRDQRVWLRAAAVACLAYGLIAFWLTPSYFQITMRNMQLVSEPGHAWSAVVEVVALIAFGAITWNTSKSRPEHSWTVFVCGALLQLTLQVLAHQYVDFRILGEPHRLIPEFDLAFLWGAALLLAWLWRRRWNAKVAVVLLLAAAGWSSLDWVQHHRILIKRVRTGPEFRIEYQLTKWIHENLPGQRVMATGSLRFWYNTWFEMPELGGGSEQGSLNMNSNIAYAQVAALDNAGAAVAWLQAMGVDAIVVHDKRSKEYYHDYEHPYLFRGVLKALYDDGEGNWIYEVPRRQRGLAHVVESARFASLNSQDPVAYAHALEQTPERGLWWQRPAPERIRLNVHVNSGERILIQETYDPAWRAVSGGREVPIVKDPFDFMLLDPGPGDHELAIEFTTPLENHIGRVLTILSIGIAAFLCIGRHK